jgi:hypothetical protein
LGDIGQNSYKTYIRINSQLKAGGSLLNQTFFAENLIWGDMFHVCMLSFVLFQSLMLGLAVKFKVETETTESDN